MRLITIFGKETNAVYAVQYADEIQDELYRLIFLWNDYEFVSTYLQERNDLLEDAFRADIKIDEAVSEIIEEVRQITIALVDHYDNGTLQQLFMPLRNDDARLYVFQHSKMKHRSRKIRRPKIRIYAIRLDANCYVITGGGIKLTKAMQDCSMLRAEITKLERCTHFLKNHEICDLL